jgi:hypothetical protein
MAPQTIKTFEKCPFWLNIPIKPLPRVIFQLKKNQNQKIPKKKLKFDFLI